jgi:hypothetical protein
LVRSQRKICRTAGVILRICVTRTFYHCMAGDAIECFQTETYGRLFETALYRMLEGKKEGYYLMLIGNPSPLPGELPRPYSALHILIPLFRYSRM